MSILRTVIAATLALTTVGTAHADALKPNQGHSIELGAVSGVAYYTVERDGFRVVTTLAQQGEATTPVRVEALLAPGQSVVLSTPRGVGIPADAVEISRQANTVLVRKAAALTN